MANLDIMIEYAQIDGKEAQITIFKLIDPDMTVIWLEK
jgi:hypothetical protein